MESSKTFLIFQFVLIVSISGQNEDINIQTCGNIFNIQNKDGNFGELTLDYNNESSLNISIQGFIVGDNNLYTNLNIKLLTSPEDINNSSKVKYRVHYPLQDILPQITSVEFNEKIYCQNSFVQTDTNEVTKVRSNFLYNVPAISKECEVIKETEIFKKDEFPWLVTIYEIKGKDDLKLLCPGNLISHLHVLTAAHCLSRFNIKDLLLILGQIDLIRLITNGPLRRTGSEIIIHPDSKPGQTSDGDLCIIKLKEPIFSTFAKPIVLWTEDDDLTGKEGIVSVWYNPRQLIPWVKRGALRIVSREECLRSNEAFQYFTSAKTFCAGSKDGGPSPCTGDSGGGLVIKRGRRYYLRGVTSSTIFNPIDLSCKKENYVVFVDIAKYASWIEDIIDGY